VRKGARRQLDHVPGIDTAQERNLRRRRPLHISG
jgi:hypothetical protein